MVNDEHNSRDVSLPVEPVGTPARAELQAARSGSVVAPLPQYAVVRFSGQDAEGFLQGQLTCDVAGLAGSASYGAWCSPQGRMLASFLLWRADSAFLMALRADIAADVRQRIARYVLRSKVTVEPAGLALIGCSGPDAGAALREMVAKLPQRRLETASIASGGAVIRLDESRFLVVLAEARAADTGAGLTRVSPQAWDWLEVSRGIPWITAPTQDKLVPQMANLERIGAVSFTKGCYTGQEIVARAQHRGMVKRRMFLANVGVDASAGDELYADDLGDQAAGLIVNAAASPGGGRDVLAVVQAASRESSTVHLRALDGPALRFLPDPAP